MDDWWTFSKKKGIRMFGLKKQEVKEPTLEDRFLQAEEEVSQQVNLIKRKRAEYASAQELSALTNDLSRLLSTWAGLKEEVGKNA